MTDGEGEPFLTWSTIATALVAYWTFATAYNIISASRPPTSIPWMGYGKGWIASIRNFTAVTKSKDWLFAGYTKYSKNNRIFVLPAIMGMQAEVVLPRSQLSWMFDQPDRILSTSEAHFDFLAGQYSFVSPVILKDPYHEHVIHKNLTRNLNAVIPEIENETPFAIEDVYGVDTQNWKKLESLQSFMEMVPILTNRMLLGQPLCRERAYLKAVLAFTQDVMRNQAILALMPKTLHILFGPLLGLTSWWHYRQASAFTLPLIKKRIADIQKKEAGDPEYAAWDPPSDFITWSYRTAMAECRIDEARSDRLAQRIMPINFASIHTTSLTAHDTLANILHADPSVIEGLREEAYSVLREGNGWTKQGLSKMHRIDSVIRESQRVSPISLTFIHRKVIAKEGITTPEGVHVAYGSLLSCPWAPLAGDHESYDEPEKFDAFRFSRPKEEYEAMSPEQKATIDTLKLKQSGAVTTAVHHLPFGHGRHACPGRFFVTHELKILFAHLLLNYDFKPLVESPKKMWVIRFQVPLPAHIEVRRRKEPWTPNVKS